MEMCDNDDDLAKQTNLMVIERKEISIIRRLNCNPEREVQKLSVEAEREQTDAENTENRGTNASEAGNREGQDRECQV
jgi:hypothetical protein